MTLSKDFTFVDLFAGAGGFAEGFYQENFYALSHIEFDKYACDTLKERMKYYNYSNDEINSISPTDMTQEDILDVMDNQIMSRDVDVIIGGPPCQSFSSQGKARDQYGMQKDPRNYLYESYMKILNHYTPKFFVFENVEGILSTKINGKILINKIFSDMKKNYKIIETKNQILQNAVNYGIPQDRKRVIIIGVRKDLENINVNDIYEDLEKLKSLQKKYTVADAISDLPELRPGDGKELIEADNIVPNEYVAKLRTSNYKFIHNHVARTHNEYDQQRYFYMSKNGWSLPELYDNKPELIHKKRRKFNNSYAVQHYLKPSKTIIAHLYKDGNQFIHPDYEQRRTFTAREAARIQSFPDDFVFPCSRTQQYKQIGNAVPPLMAKHIASILKKYLLKTLS
jgi:DNA (cytosine-5)-methyltransferase 1